MILNKLKNTIVNKVINTLGWHTDEKIVVFESDDWGSIRTSSHQSLLNLKKKGFDVSACPYTSLDALESNEDVEILKDTLLQFKDKDGGPPVFTLNNIVANPNFEKIRASAFQKYYFEFFTETYKKYPVHDNVFNLLKEGISKKVFSIQYHGREHINVAQWMNALQKKDEMSLFLFNEKMFSAHISGPSSCRNEYLQSFGLFHQDEIQSHCDILNEGLQIFNEIWGFHPKSFIAPCYTWHESLEKILAENDIFFLQGTHVQKQSIVPVGNQYFRKKVNYTGKRNKHDQFHIIRNGWFEPSTDAKIDHVALALKNISDAFKAKKPAVICTHRLNYIGYLSKKNRNKNIDALSSLLSSITKLWPQVRFLSSAQLGEVLNN